MPTRRRFALYTTTLMRSGFYLKGDRLWVYNQKSSARLYNIIIAPQSDEKDFGAIVYVRSGKNYI
ncbi:hypothetical protein [Nostoc sp. 'Peltigera malacea cyanobiont' DB3992]|uniref:hypothetical protein n=1 Tax=Nostoc sp. 'Peltigera malacea cyanobiont' DB3992 TaxID=1206980 RepID=UPI00117C2BB5|nr:hypothetical protein [Nostoc sp. 'Peltigera malacea cyanobiont' DB3992]